MMDDKIILKYAGFTCTLIGLLLFIYIVSVGLLPRLNNIHIMNNPLFFLILGLTCFFYSIFIKHTNKLAEVDQV